MILVVGATGLLGGMISKQLLDKEETTRILVRDNSTAAEMAKVGLGTPAETLISAGAQPFFGDLKDRSSLDEACRDVTTVISTANSILRGGEDTIESVDLKGTQNLIDAAQEAGVQHFIYVSAIGADASSTNPLIQAKAVCEAKLQASSMSYTILQPGVFMEVWIGAVIGAPLQAGQPVTLVEPGDHHHAFVSAHDVAAYAVMAIDHGAAHNAFIRIGGPEAYSWQDIVNSAADVLGQPLPINYVAIGDPIPLLPEAMVPLMVGMETYESYINMNAATMVFKIKPTSLDTFMQGFFATVATA
jgi:NADH dehydrogenase